MSITAIADKSTREFYDDRIFNAALHDLVGPLPRNPDPLRERFTGDLSTGQDGLLANAFTAKSAADVQAAQDAQLSAQFDKTLNAKDLIATIAWAIQLKDPAAWAAKTPIQKKAQVQAELGNLKTMRMFVEKNL